jgi:hypothetical protein
MTVASLAATVWAWLLSHPAVDTIVLWPIATAGINLAWKDASEYADTHPRFAPFKKLVQKWGLSPRGTLDLIGRLLTARGLPPPPPPSADDSGSFGKLSAGIVPTVPPVTKPDVNAKLALFGFMFAVCILLVGCGGAQTHDDIHLTAYGADDQLCVTEATDKDAGTQCLDKYQRLYGPFWADSGLTVCEVGFDAGADGGK